MGDLNYIEDFYKELIVEDKLVHARLKKNPSRWDRKCKEVVRKIMFKARQLPCLKLPHPITPKIVEIDLGYGGILKQKTNGK